MVERGEGAIVNVSSQASKVAIHQEMVYCKSTHALQAGFPLIRISGVIDAILLAGTLSLYCQQHFGIRQDTIILRLKI